MEIFDLANEKQILAHNGMEVAYGVGPSGLADGKASDLLTFLYAATPGLLQAGGQEILIPSRSVAVVRPGLEAKLLVTADEEKLPMVTFRVPEQKQELTAEQLGKLEHAYELNKSEWNTEIQEFFGNLPSYRFAHDGLPLVTLYNESSRQVTFLIGKGKNVKSGWYTTAFKNQPLSISDAVWQSVRLNEIAHYHNVIREAYVILDGTANMYVNGDILPVRKGSFGITHLADTHKIDTVELGDSGNYHHICVQYPSITMDKGERVNVDTKEGFSVKG